MDNFKFKNESNFFVNKYIGIAQLQYAEQFITDLEKLCNLNHIGFETFVALLGENKDVLEENIKKYKERINVLVEDNFPF